MIALGETLEVAFQSLFRNKLRAFLTMLGIIIGVSSIILLISIGSGLKSYVAKQFEQLGSNTIFIASGDGKSEPPGTSLVKQVLTVKDVKRIKRIGYPVKSVSGFVAAFSKIKYRGIEETISINATDEEGIKMSNYQAELGRIISQEEVEKRLELPLSVQNLLLLFLEKPIPLVKPFLLNQLNIKLLGFLKAREEE